MAETSKFSTLTVHNRFVILSAILLVFMVGSVAAALDSIEITNKMHKNSVQESLTITLTENDLSEITLTLPSDAYDISVNGKERPSNENQFTLALSCLTCVIEAAYTLDNIVRNNRFLRSVDFPEPETFQYSVTLPAGTLIRKGENQNIVPKPSSIETDGQQIMVVWESENPVFPQAYVIELEQPRSNMNFVVVSLFLLLIIFIAVLILALMRNKKKEIPKTLFSKDEQCVIDTIKSLPKPVTQKQIGNHLNWSKSKTSAVVSGLAYKKVVTREKMGRNHKVFLEKEFQ